MPLLDTSTLSPDQYEDLLAEQDWDSLSKRLTEFAYRKLHKTSWEDAEDVAQTAVRRAFDASCQRWNPKAQPDIFWFLGNMVPGILANQRRKRKSGRVETPYDHEDLDALASEAVEAPDVAIAKRARARIIVDELRTDVATDRAATLVLAAFEAEIDDPQEQARATDLTMQAVYNARSKLRARAAQIAQTYDREALQ